MRGLFAELDLVTGKLQVLDKVKASVEGLLKELSRNKSTSLRAAAEEYIAQSGSQPLNQWWLTEGILKLDLTAKATGVQASIEAAASNLRDLIALVDGLRKSVVDEKNAIEDKLRKQFAEDASMQKIADLRANAAKRLQRVTELRNAYLKAWNALLEALKQHSAIAAGIQTVQDQIAGIRARHNARVEARLNAFLPEGMKVSIRLDPGRDTAEFEKRLYEMYGARSNQIKKIRAAIKHNCSPVTFSAMVIESKLGTLVGKSVSEETLDGTFDASDQAELETRTRLYEDDENAQVQVLVESGKRLKEVLDTQQSRWEDHEAILLNEVPVNEKSPGQRSSAMLPLIALAEQTPLVIDQPEDNLDKKLIGDVLARVLADLKEKRQIIVATHDPNILVGGDAEQVVVLEAESDRRASVVNHGSIDNHDIVEAVIDLLEGGKEAFEARRKRYQDRTSSL
ncbi:MAG: ATP-binding protein [Deltaproteobacteria bacterium]|nr:ATP-binding protein [Deltaproteobacteria bacterium]